ncbi:MAG TPA: hypothetical protein VHV76_16405 [Mycobacteriales bacterium]|jgi:hypothetical protein|nr:hypothetical protein [Mycobacteriales bacterium]
MTEPVLPDSTSDELEVGWGDDLDGVDDDLDHDEELAADRPPHYDRDQS